MNSLVSLIAIVVAVSAAPQSFNSEDAEVISSPSGGEGLPFPRGIDVFFVRPPRIPSFFDFFGPRQPADEGSSPEVSFVPIEPTDEIETDSGLPGIFNIFSSFIPTIFNTKPSPPIFPTFPDSFSTPDLDNLPNGYDNTTYEVKIINGTQYEVNRTIATDENGLVIFTQVLLKLTPENVESSPNSDTAADGEVFDVNDEFPIKPALETTLEEADPAGNQDNSSLPLVRRKRSIIDWFNSLGRRKPRPSTSSEEVPLRKPVSPLIQPEAPVSEEFISYIGDTNVNYRGPRPRNNPDAEIFDVELLRADADRYAASRPQPIASEPRRIPKPLPIPKPFFWTDAALDLRPLSNSLDEADAYSFAGDTDVNYRGPTLRNNPDAEIFDVELVRADANRYLNRPPNTVDSNSVASDRLR